MQLEIGGDERAASRKGTLGLMQIMPRTVMIEAMVDVRRAIFEGYERLHPVLLQVVHHDAVCCGLMTVPGVVPLSLFRSKWEWMIADALRDLERLARILV